MRRRSALVLTIPALGALAAAGCGSSSDDARLDTAPAGDLVPIVARAAAETSTASTGRFTATTSMDGGVIGDMELTAEGAFDNDAGRSIVTIDTSAMFGGLAGESGLDLGELGDLGGEWTVVVDGDTAYMDMGGLGAMFGAGDGWVSIPAGIDATAATPMGPVGAQEMLDVLTGVGEVSEVGTESVRGVETTHYVATIDGDALLAGAGDQAAAEGIDPEELQQALDAFDEAGVEIGDVPVDVWVDGDGAVRRVVMELSVDALGDTVTTTMTAEYFDFGEPVDIPVPDPSEVTAIDPEALAGGDLGGLLGD